MPKAASSEERPERVNNAENIYFPPVFSQDGGSCGSASRIAYMFNYEINALRGLDGSLEDNQYPTHFTWLLTNSGSSKDVMAIACGVPNVTTYGGRTYSRLFGNQDCADPDFGWMNGYDKWYAAMFNRLGQTANFPLSVATEEGREAVKNWLWNHNGDPDFKAGGICGIGVASAGIWKNIPATDVNDGIGVTGDFFVQSWGNQIDHAMTIVGYDDRIEFDLDGNGVAGERDKDEVGAWILVNSWGADWNNSGFVYCPYKNAVTTGNGTDYYYPEVYHVRKDYRPLRTFKIRMEYSKRSEICLSAGISADLDATVPERTVKFEHFRYAGDGDGDGMDAETPMLGRWTDGMHYEPMEFGYDLTDLSAQFDTRRPLKYFFIIDTKTQASGTGKVHACSLMDYEFDVDGIELPFDIADGGVTIENQGKRTVLTLVVGGEPMHAPRNLMADGQGLAWEVPAASPYVLKAYNIYEDGRLLARLGADATRYDVAVSGTGYGVSAVYDYEGADYESARATLPASAVAGKVPESNHVRSFSNSGFRVKDLFSAALPAATIEYWLKPVNCVDWNQQMGPGWNRGFMSHTTAAGEFVAGWNTGNRVTTAPGTLKAGQWTHIAVVIDGGRLITYINGENAGEIETSYGGLDGFGSFEVGTGGTRSGINGSIDEFRVWSVARTSREIQGLMYAEIAEPEHTPGLMLELKMDEHGVLAPVDATGRHTIELLSGSQERVTDNNLLTDSRPLKAAFTLPYASCSVGAEVMPHNVSSVSSVRWVWSVDGNSGHYDMEQPVFVFDEPGEKVIHLTVYDASGNSAETSGRITVLAPTVPVAGFEPTSLVVPVGQRVSFVNTTVASGSCRYEWSMPGATVERAITFNAAACYETPGEYVVRLTAVNAAGSHVATRRITVCEQAPKADFEVLPAVILKGGNVALRDRSSNVPEAFRWRVSDNSRVLVGEGADHTFVMDAPGRYDVRLDVSNALGSDALVRKGALVVCNADALTGLNFTGDASETVTFRHPIASQAGFTIDWWMYAKGNRNYCHQIGNSAADFLMLTAADGSLSISMGNMNYKTAAGFVVPSEWHHYAVVFDNGNIYVYKDCRLESMFNTPWIVRRPAMPERMSLGGSEGPMNAVIDEFRVWNSALSADDLKAYANQPLADVSDAESRKQLALYYGFNQSSGNVIDATSNGNVGERSGFGPEGDAWSSSLGAFCLSEGSRPDVTADYLTNYRKPFLASDATVNPSDANRFRALLQGSPQSTWKVENPTVFRDVITGVYVDGKLDNAMALMLKDMDFEAEVTNHKAYQTIMLPAGYYAFGMEGKGTVMERESYFVVAGGEGLPDTDKLSAGALAYAPFSAGEVVFGVDSPTRVSVGMLLNLRGETTLEFHRFYLETLFTNDDFSATGISSELAGSFSSEAPSVSIEGRTVHISVPSPRRVSACTLAGLPVFDGWVRDVVSLKLEPGFYVIAGRKIVLR